MKPNPVVIPLCLHGVDALARLVNRGKAPKVGLRSAKGVMQPVNQAIHEGR